MGGKGRRRREKNYLAAHGGPARLPPPVDPSQVDAVPSKLRKLMEFTSPSIHGSAKASKDTGAKRRTEAGNSQKKEGFESKSRSEAHDANVEAKRTCKDEEIVENGTVEKKKKKRKRKQVTDRRFETEVENLGVGSKRKERKKKYLRDRKKGNKKVKTEDSLSFPGREDIKFGEVVDAPPKLVTIPKDPKNRQAASKERLRLKAIDAYRKRKGWTSRPGGLQLPPPVTI